MSPVFTQFIGCVPNAQNHGGHAETLTDHCGLWPFGLSKKSTNQSQSMGSYKV